MRPQDTVPGNTCLKFQILNKSLGWWQKFQVQKSCSFNAEIGNYHAVFLCEIRVNWPFIIVWIILHVLIMYSVKSHSAKLSLHFLSSDCTRLGQRLPTATSSSDQRRQCMMLVVNRGKWHLQCGDKPQPQTSVMFEVMHKTFFVYFPLLPSDLSCLMYRRQWLFICVVVMPILCA